MVEAILQMRIMVNNEYYYEQDRLVNQLHRMWGNENASHSVQHNDKLQLLD